MRALAIAAGLLLAGCQLVFPRDAADEDGDGVPDDIDPCPHIANEDPADNDSDGIADVCDLDPDRADDHVFFSFAAGRPSELSPVGPVTAIDGGLEIGSSADPQSAHDGLVLDLGARLARVDLGIEILERADPLVGFAELGIFIQHANFGLDGDGISCFVGRDTLDLGQPNYIQMQDSSTSRFDGELEQVHGRFSALLTPTSQTCSVELGSPDSIVSRDSSLATEDVSGKIAITTTQLKVRLEYLWIAYTTEPLSSRR